MAVAITSGPKNNYPPKLTAKQKDYILQEMKKNPNLIKVDVPAGFFTPAQNKQLQALLKKNNEAAKKREEAAAKALIEKKASINSRVRWKLASYAAVGGIVGVIGMLMFAATVPMMLATALGSIALFSSAAFLYQKYAEYAANKYRRGFPTTPDKTDKESAQLGANAVTWKGYFTSFAYSAPYLSPRVYVAAKEHALNQETEITKKLTSLKV
jgi:hypothetical protein